MYKHIIKNIEDLKEYKNNPRTHDTKQVEQLVKSIKEYGFTNPILIDDNDVIIAGHGRKMASEQLNLEQVPCIVLSGLTEKQKKAYVIADNKMALNAGWDSGLLKDMLQDLDDGSFDMELTGFDDVELEGLMTQVYSGDEVKEDSFDVDKAIDGIIEPIIKRGEVWQLGKHRLMCGSSASIEDMGMLMNGEKVDMVFTDPPYGVSIGTKNKTLNIKGFGKGGRCQVDIKNDTLPPKELHEILVKAFANAKKVMNECCACYVTSPQGGELGMMMMMMMMMADAGLEVKHVLIWVKNVATFSMGRLDYDYQHEPILFTWNKTHKRIKKGEFQTSCWFIDKPRESKLHPTMKPIKLIENALLNSSEEGDTVLDLFGGSGSTMIACEQIKRKCYTMELDEKYCDVIIKRWESLTGKKAVKEGG